MRTFFFTFLFFLCTIFSFSQRGRGSLLHEIGFVAGPVSMQTDFGERHHFPSSVLNIGYGVGLIYYISFNPKQVYWNDRTTSLKNKSKIRFEATYMSDNLIQRGRYIQSNSSQAILLKGIVSNAKLYNFGAQYEFSLYSASDFKIFQPYFSIGAVYSVYKPQVKSLLGDIEQNPSLIPNAYINGIHNQGGGTTSFTIGAGTKYLTRNDNLKYILDFRWQRFFKDDIEGLTPLISANKYNDWLFFLNVGVVFSVN